MSNTVAYLLVILICLMAAPVFDANNAPHFGTVLKGTAFFFGVLAVMEDNKYRMEKLKKDLQNKA